MPTFPDLRSGAPTKAGAERGLRLFTRTVRFLDDTEQRWNESPGLHSFSLQFTSVDSMDLAAVLDFFRARKGRGETFDVVLDGVTYSNCSFVDDTMAWEEKAPGRFDFALKVEQLQ